MNSGHIEAFLEEGQLQFWTLDLRTGAVELRRAGARVVTWAAAELAVLRGLLDPGGWERLRRAALRSGAGGSDLDVLCGLTVPSGRRGWVQLSAQRDPRAGAGGPRLLGVARNVTRQHAEYEQLTEHEAQLRAVIDQTLVGMYIKDCEGRFVLANPYMRRIAGALGPSLTGRRSQEVFDLTGVPGIAAMDQEVLSTGRSLRREVSLEEGGQARTLLFTKAPYWKGGQLSGIVGFMQDITRQKDLEHRAVEQARELEARVLERTEELRRANDLLRFQATHDDLTGLPNRRYFLGALQDMLTRRSGETLPGFALLLLDMDGFKRINDRFGHAAGDVLLRQFAQRLALTLEGEAKLARLGGDEFVILMPGADRAQASLQVERILGTLQLPFLVEGRDLQIGSSIGMTLPSSPLLSAEDCLRQADIAMYRAKATNRGRMQVFEPWMLGRHTLLLSLQTDLQDAARLEQLTLQYQPVVSLTDDTVRGVEALVRWQHPEHGQISPGEFIALAEGTGMIREIDLWVLRRSCRAMLPLVQAGRLAKLSVNFSPRHFDQPGLPEQIAAILSETGFPHHALVVEITEGVFMRRHRLANVMLRELLRQGVGVAVDDFGTGYSSLSYVQRLPLSDIKVDRSFVAAAAQYPGIIRSIVDLALGLDMTVVAEGVETPEQLEVVRALGCDYAQGYLLSRPLLGPDLIAWLDARDAAAEAVEEVQPANLGTALP
ncbi:putative bifunctional diguanylate cyclase/phosphodiesterase [Deinococcus aerophilus]|uniref:GGDEF domain-containing protein n=1 Tax=Deinococcus aerophilus TaxID=522488 RepID=A0ABQ2GSN9_9DEIO|nr:bifunctional diguanylate cyclase/phosphodiesterase [Deinococcus aerophilus]GGM10127.1 hypothetical protein GCM10010841_18210 [Deinococcus aerophilus]